MSIRSHRRGIVTTSHAVSGTRARSSDSFYKKPEPVPLPEWTSSVPQGKRTTYSQKKIPTAQWAYKKLVDKGIIRHPCKFPAHVVTCSWCGREVKTYCYNPLRYGTHRCPNSYGLVTYLLPPKDQSN